MKNRSPLACPSTSDGFFRKNRIIPAVVAGCLSVAISSALQAQTTYQWNLGDGDGNWSTPANWSVLTGAGTTFPSQNNDTAVLTNVGAGATRNIAIDGGSTGVVGVLRIEQTTATGATELSLARNWGVQSAGALRYNTTSTTFSNSSLATADLFVLDLNGFIFTSVTSSTANPQTQGFLGTLVFDTAGSAYQSGLGTSNTRDQIFGNASAASGQKNAIIQVTANGLIGRVNTSNSSDISVSQTITFAAQAAVNVSNNATLQLRYQGRSVDQDAADLIIQNSGDINIGAGSTLSLERVNNANVIDAQAISDIEFTNNAGGNVNHGGTVNITPDRNGASSISNAGNWIVSGSGGKIVNSASNVSGAVTPTFSNQSSGVIRGSGTSDIVEYDAPNFASQRLAITNQGIVSPGNGNNGVGLTSVGELKLRDIDLAFAGADDTLRLDIGGTGAGQFDVLSLESGLTGGTGAGTLTLDNSALALYYVNGFDPSSNYSLTILNYGSLSGTFDLSSLQISGVSGAAADINNYSISYGLNSATLNFTAVPEPTSAVLVALAGVIGVIVNLRRRRRACIC